MFTKTEGNIIIVIIYAIVKYNSIITKKNLVASLINFKTGFLIKKR